RQQRVAEAEARRADAVSTYMSKLYEWADSESRPASGGGGATAGANLSIEELLDEGTRRLREGEIGHEPLTQATLMVAIGEVYRRLGVYDRALPLLSKAAAIRMRELGEE